MYVREMALRIRGPLAGCLALLLIAFATSAAADTRLVKDFYPGPATGGGAGLTDVNGTVIFGAHTPEHGAELWRTDGSASGTVLIKDIFPGSEDSSPNELTAVGNTVFFNAVAPGVGAELWRSDGTAAGTAMVKETTPGVQLGGAAGPRELTAFDGRLFFVTVDGTNNRRSLWASDGTEAGTVVIADLGPTPFFDTDPRAELTVAGQALYFIAHDPQHGQEVWRTDGTAAGTALVKDINPSDKDSLPSGLTEAGGMLYFSAEYRYSPDDPLSDDRLLWRSDGTDGGTVPIADPANGPRAPYGLTAIGSRLFFIASDPQASGYDLWRSDGTSAGTARLTDFPPEGGPATLYDFNGLAMFTAHPDQSDVVELWRSDGTAAGTAKLSDVAPYTNPAFDFVFWATYKDRMYFQATGSDRLTFWRTDGTTPGTTQFTNLGLPFSYSGTPMAVSGGRLYFNAFAETCGVELWSTDGSPTVTPPACGETQDPGAESPQEEPSNRFSFPSDPVSRPNGSVVVRVSVPGPGTLRTRATAIVDTKLLKAQPSALRTIVVAKKTAQPTRAGTVRIVLKPRRLARRVLARRGRLRSRLRVKYTPTGGETRTKWRRVTFKLKR